MHLYHFLLYFCFILECRASPMVSIIGLCRRRRRWQLILVVTSDLGGPPDHSRTAGRRYMIETQSPCAWQDVMASCTLLVTGRTDFWHADQFGAGGVEDLIPLGPKYVQMRVDDGKGVLVVLRCCLAVSIPPCRERFENVLPHRVNILAFGNLTHGIGWHNCIARNKGNQLGRFPAQEQQLYLRMVCC